MSTETECRRCSDCRDMTHHWMDNPDFGNDEGDAEHSTEATHLCKHCDALGMECDHCDGDGCSSCLQEGVVEIEPDQVV